MPKYNAKIVYSGSFDVVDIDAVDDKDALSKAREEANDYLFGEELADLIADLKPVREQDTVELVTENTESR